MTDLVLPDGAYLAWWYDDPRGGGRYGRVYWADGRVESTDGVLCRFTGGQVAAARAAVRELDRAGAQPGQGGFDTADVVYVWRVDGHGGRLRYRYPPEPAAVQALERRLTELEEAAGGWPLLADE